LTTFAKLELALNAFALSICIDNAIGANYHLLSFLILICNQFKAAAERRVEIDEHKALLRTKLFAINEEKTRRICQRNEAFSEVERRKKR